MVGIEDDLRADIKEQILNITQTTATMSETWRAADFGPKGWTRCDEKIPVEFNWKKLGTMSMCFLGRKYGRTMCEMSLFVWNGCFVPSWKSGTIKISRDAMLTSGCDSYINKHRRVVSRAMVNWNVCTLSLKLFCWLTNLFIIQAMLNKTSS